MRNAWLILTLLAGFTGTAVRAFGHFGVVVGHSPPDPGGQPPCPTLDPLKLFLLPDPRIGSPIEIGQLAPAQPGEATVMARLATNALLARPEFGGFAYTEDSPGFDYVDSTNECHAMTTAHTGGQPFTVGVQRGYWPDGVNLAVVDAFGALVLAEEGDVWMYANESVGHHHPFWLARGPGRYYMSNLAVSSFFFDSDEYSLTFVTSPECATAVPFDMSGVFNADVVDSDAGDIPTAFDGAGHSWVLDGHYGTDRGLPLSGALEVFQLGGPTAGGLLGAAFNCLFDNGVSSSQAVVDVSAAGRAGRFQTIELLIGAAGAFTSSDSLVVRMGYVSGNQQVVTIKRAASSPRFFPINDWQIASQPAPHLSVGPSGTRDGGGFVRSTGSGVDAAPQPPESFFFQRVTFPVDVTRDLNSVSFDNYTGGGRVGVFAMTGFEERICPTGDHDNNGDVDAVDYSFWPACFEGPGVVTDDPACLVFDFDFDEDVDSFDFAAFQERF